MTTCFYSKLRSESCLDVFSVVLVHAVICCRFVMSFSFFTALHALYARCLATRKLSVRLSVCLSVKRVICDKMKETCAKILTPYKRSFILVFWKEQRLVGSDPLYVKFLVKLTCWVENADFQSIFARSASTVTPSEKLQLTLIVLSSELKMQIVRCF